MTSVVTPVENNSSLTGFQGSGDIVKKLSENAAPPEWAAPYVQTQQDMLAILPALVPETILVVGLLVLIKAIDQPRTYLILLLGHILLALPFVVLVIQARLIGIRRVYEEAVGVQGRKEPLVASALTVAEKKQLNALLRRMMLEFERAEGGPPPEEC